MRILHINDVDKIIEDYFDKEDFEQFARILGPRSNIHNVIFYENMFVIHACVEEEDTSQNCVIRVIAKDGSLRRQFFMDDFFEEVYPVCLLRH